MKILLKKFKVFFWIFLNKKYYLILLVLFLVFCGYSVGVLATIKGYQPKTFVINFYKTLKDWDRFETINPSYLETNIDSLISIRTKNDIIEKRNELIQLIWSNQGFPYSKMPNKIEEGFKDSRYTNLDNLNRIDKITIVMDYGLNSIIYHFQPIEGNQKLMIYHQGHGGDFINGKKTINFFLSKGYSVMAFSMPVFGMNNQPVVDLERFGKFKLESHSRFNLLETDKIYPIKFFLEPVVIGLNSVKKFNYQENFMIGISGGGWTTTLYSVIDPRIFRSYAVAGSLPLFLRNIQEWGDYEQNVFELYDIANYLELYILGSYGENRSHTQILNKYDPVVFSGVKYQVYEEKVKEIVSDLGKGEFEIYLDEGNRKHTISVKTLEIIIDNIENY